MFLRSTIVVVGTVLATASVLASEPKPPTPADAFYRNPSIKHAELSPSGRWLALTTAVGGGRMRLVVSDLQDPGKANLAAGLDDADVQDIWWVNDDRLLFNVIDLQRGGGDQRFVSGLFSVHRDGSDLRQLVKPTRDFVTGRTPIGRPPLEWNHRLLHVPAGGGNEVIVGETVYGRNGEPLAVHAKRLDVLTRQTASLASGAPDHVWIWWFDAKGEPRVAYTRHEGRGAVHVRNPSGHEWRVVNEHAVDHALFTPHSVGATGTLYVHVSERGFRVLTTLDESTGRPRSEALMRSPGFDFTGRIVSESLASPALGVRILTDAETTVWLDDRLKTLQKEADARMPGRVNRITCRRCAERDMVAMVHSFSDRDPGQYWVYFADGARWQRVGAVRVDIDPQNMATTDFERIRARDGHDLPLWITKPPGPKEPRAAVLLVHGGPWVRGREWKWEANAQFLASRGYVVLEPEFRGSTGFGRAHYEAGWRQWGRAMQDDLADAVLWASKHGLIDPARVCIAGGSYGGYATLMGLVRHPELYRCGVAASAISDLRLMIDWWWGSDVSDEARVHGWQRLIGDPVNDAEMLAENSPVRQAHRIKAPVMLAHGAQDRRVSTDHATAMREAMRKAGQEPEWIVYADEGHGWLKVETQVDFAQRLERFLARHLRSN